MFHLERRKKSSNLSHTTISASLFYFYKQHFSFSSFLHPFYFSPVSPKALSHISAYNFPLYHRAPLLILLTQKYVLSTIEPYIAARNRTEYKIFCCFIKIICITRAEREVCMRAWNIDTQIEVSLYTSRRLSKRLDAASAKCSAGRSTSTKERSLWELYCIRILGGFLESGLLKSI